SSLYRLERADDMPGGGGSAGSAEVPHQDAPLSDSNAERAEPAEPFSGFEDRLSAEGLFGVSASPAALPNSTANNVPQVPQVPHSDSDRAPKHAEPPSDERPEVPQEVPHAPPPPGHVPCQ